MGDSKQTAPSRAGVVTSKARVRRQEPDPLADALGASKIFDVTQGIDGPFGAAALLEEVQQRLVSRGGRPSDPKATIRRLVPLKRQVWKTLQSQAKRLSRRGRPISPGQLAAVLLEKGISHF